MYGHTAYAEYAYAEPIFLGTIKDDLQALAADAIIELFVVDATGLGGTLSRFHAGTNGLKTSVVWQGHTYPAMAIEITGFEMTGKGKLPRPTMKISNVDGVMGVLVDAYEDLIGTVVTRKRTLKRYLDAVNFTSAINLTADSTAEFPDDVYAINRKATHTKEMIEFELASAFDIHGVKIPLRQIVQHVCTFSYRGSECGYAGGAVATANDVPTAVLALDVCGKRIASCVLRFGTASLPYGGFPGASVIAG